MGNAGLYLVQHCPNPRKIRIIGVRISEGPRYEVSVSLGLKRYCKNLCVRARPCMRAFSLKTCGIINLVYGGNNNCERKMSDALFFQVREI